MLDRFFNHKKAPYRFTISEGVDLVNASDWESINDENLYLSLPYLKAMEHSMTNFGFYYVIAYNEELKAVFKAYFQLLEIKGVDQRYKQWLYERFGKTKLDKLVPGFDLRILICGNLFVCGENGFEHSPLIDRNEASGLLISAIHKISRDTESKGRTSLTLIKELLPEHDPGMESFSDERYHPFEIDCNMVLRLREDWDSMDAYYQSMTSKFRTKGKSIMKRSAELTTQAFTADLIAIHAEEINELHNAVVERAEFSLGELHAKAFEAMKRNLAEDMLFTAYYLKNKLVGFSVAFLGKDFVDAAHVGLNYELIAERSLYQRMLHDFVALGIAEKRSEVRFGRTAEQLKSSLGAEPVNMRLYIKHRNGLVNHLIKPVIEQVKPSTFELRQPFKKSRI